MSGRRILLSAGLAVLVLSAACAPQQRMGMVMDERTGLQYGAAIERSLLADPSQFVNRKIKVRARNASGDPAFDIRRFASEIQDAYLARGYQRGTEDDFGLLLDVVVEYSGQVSKDMSLQYAFLGAAGGGVAGARSKADAGTAIGVVSGATLGAVVGGYDTEDTYIVIAKVSLGVREATDAAGKSITFSRSAKRIEDKGKPAYKPWKRRWQSYIAVYAGGRRTPQSAVASEVRRRLVRITSEII